MLHHGWGNLTFSNLHSCRTLPPLALIVSTNYIVIAVTMAMDPCNPGRETCTQVGLELAIAKSDYFCQNLSRIQSFQSIFKNKPVLERK